MIKSKKIKHLFFLIMAIFIGFGSFAPKLAFANAADDNVSSIDKAMCNAYNIFNGPLGKTFAIFAIVALGVAFFLGKVNWGTAIAVAMGIGAIFGAPALVTTITKGGNPCASTAS